MTVKIKAPDGSVINFPDGTPDSTILEVMRREYGGLDPAMTQPPMQDSPLPEGVPQLPGANIRSEITPDGVQRMRDPTWGETAADAGRSFATGFRQSVAAIPGIPGSLEARVRGAIDTMERQMGRPSDVSSGQVLPTITDTVRHEGEAGLAPYHTPETTTGRYAHTLGGFAPGAIMPGGPVARALTNTTLPALASEYAGQRYEGTPYETPSRVAAALAAPYAPRAIGRAVTPLPAPANRTAVANALADEGVELSAGQRTGNRVLRYMESAATETPLAGPNMADLMERQGGQYTRAAMRRVDETGTTVPNDALATQEWLREARLRIGGEFNRLTGSHDIVFTGRAGRPRAATLQSEALRLEAEYNAVVPDTLQRNPMVRDLVDDIANTIAQGRMPGRSYQDWRSRFSRMANDARTSDPQFSRFVGGLQRALDDAMESGLPAGEQAAWQRARREWAHLLTLENAAASAGENAAMGVVSPQQLAAAARSGRRVEYAEGRAPFAGIAHEGAAAMGILPNSGTPARLNVTSQALTGMLMGGAMGRTVGNPVAQAYLGNQLLAGPLNAMGRTRPGLVARSLALPIQMPETLTGQ